MKPLITLLLLGATTFAAGASAFSDAVETIVNASPTLAAEEARAASALEALRAEGVLVDPEVEFERLWNASGGENKWSAGISQELNSPWTYRRRSHAISAQRQLTEVQSEARRIQARANASNLIIEIIAARKECVMLTEMDSLMRSLQATVKKAWDNGETTIIDLNKTSIETARSAERLRQSRAKADALMAELQAMAGTEKSIGELAVLTDGLEMPFALPESVDTYLAALETSPLLTQAQLAVSAAETQTALERSRRWQGFSVGYAHAYEEGSHFNGITVGVSLPLWSRRSAVSAAVSNSLAASFEASATRSRLENQVRADHAAATDIRDQMTLFAPAVEGTDNLTLLRKAFDGGELSLLLYLQEVNYFMEARLDYLNLTKEYALRLISLQRFVPAK